MAMAKVTHFWFCSFLEGGPAWLFFLPPPSGFPRYSFRYLVKHDNGHEKNQDRSRQPKQRAQALFRVAGASMFQPGARGG